MLELRLLGLECAISEINYETGEAEIIRTVGQRTKEEEIQDFARSVGTMPDGDRIKAEHITKFFLVKSIASIAEKIGEDEFERDLPVCLLRTIELTVASLISRTRDGVGAMIGQMNEHMKRNMKSSRNYHLNGVVLRLSRVRNREGGFSTKVTWTMDQGKLLTVMLGLQGTQMFQNQQVVMGEDKSKFSIQINRGGFSSLLSILYLAACNYAGLTGVFHLVNEVMLLISGVNTAHEFVVSVLEKWRSLSDEDQKKVAMEVGRENLYSGYDRRAGEVDLNDLTTIDDWMNYAFSTDVGVSSRILEMINDQLEKDMSEADIVARLRSEIGQPDPNEAVAALSVSDDLGSDIDMDPEGFDWADEVENPENWEFEHVEDGRFQPVDEW
jgi:hypothetical protein